ncbi:MAG: DUF5652 family protein [Ktedonobacteraceae bacterium]
MKRILTIHTLYLAGLAALFVGAMVDYMGLKGNPQALSGKYTHFTQFTQPIHPAVYTLGTTIMGIALLLIVVAWVWALIKTARNRQWIWFICLILFSLVALLVYIFVEERHRPAQVELPPQQQYVARA